MPVTHTQLRLSDPARPGYDACTGCHVCALPCPVWQQTRDPRLTLKGRARALLHGASVLEVADSTLACVLCGACEAVCPEDIDTVGLTLGLRRALTEIGENPLAGLDESPVGERNHARGELALLPRGIDEELRARVRAALGAELASDDGRDIAQRIEAGLEVPAERSRAFVASLPPAVVVADGLLARELPRLGYRGRIRTLGEALLALPGVVRALGAGDLLVIESRGFHADHRRLVRFYDRIRVERGCDTNLDLQRVAIATGAGAVQAAGGALDVGRQVRWILEGKSPQRVVVEAFEDLAAFRSHADVPVCHLAELHP